MVINLFFFIYSIIIIFGKGEGGRGLIFGGDIVCRIRGLTFGGGAYFRRFTVWLYLGPISEKFALRRRFLQSTVPQNQTESDTLSNLPEVIEMRNKFEILRNKYVLDDMERQPSF